MWCSRCPGEMDEGCNRCPYQYDRSEEREDDDDGEDADE